MAGKKQYTASEMGRLGGRARAAELSKDELTRIAKKAVGTREAIRSGKRKWHADPDLARQMEDEFRARYADSVLAELRTRKKEWRDELPEVRAHRRHELRQQLERSLQSEVRRLFTQRRPR